MIHCHLRGYEDGTFLYIDISMLEIHVTTGEDEKPRNVEQLHSSLHSCKAYRNNFLLALLLRICFQILQYNNYFMVHHRMKNTINSINQFKLWKLYLLHFKKSEAMSNVTCGCYRSIVLFGSFIFIVSFSKRTRMCMCVSIYFFSLYM